MQTLEETWYNKPMDETNPLTDQVNALVASASALPPPALPADADEDWGLAGRDPDAAWADRNARKPNISHLKPALVVVDGAPLPLFNIGDKIVIERYASVLAARPWLDTLTYTVESIDDETGVVGLWNEDLKQHALGNYITGPKKGDVYCLAIAKETIGKKKRGRPRVRPLPPEGEPKPVRKGKRGRPPGSKNRPKDVIAAERAAKEKRAEVSAKRKRGRPRKVKLPVARKRWTFGTLKPGDLLFSIPSSMLNEYLLVVATVRNEMHGAGHDIVVMSMISISPDGMTPFTVNLNADRNDSDFSLLLNLLLGVPF